MDQKIKHARLINQTSRDFDSIPDRNIMRQDIIKRQDNPRVGIPVPPPMPPQLNLPRRDFVGSRAEYIDVCVPLYEASIKGDWETAVKILNVRPQLVRCAITENYETTLHVAVSAEDNKLTEHFVRNLVNKMHKEDLALRNLNQNTAFCLAAAAGSVKLAEIMLKKNKDLLEIPGSRGKLPLYFAALFGKGDMVKYLYSVSRDMKGVSREMEGYYWTDRNKGSVLLRCVEADMFDVAIDIVKNYSKFSTKSDVCRDVLHVLARKPDAFNRREGNIVRRIISSIFPIKHQKLGLAEKDSDAMQLLRIIWKDVKIMPKDAIEDIIRKPATSPKRYTSSVLFVAAETGNTRFLVELIGTYPDLIWMKNDNGLSIIHIAVIHRHEEIYNLLYEMGSMKDFIIPLTDDHGNNMLHLVGKSSERERGQAMWGVPKRMQREVLWFEEVEMMVPLPYREMDNKNGETPYKVFSEKNTDLVSQGMKWINDCMVVATLIITVAFAVAFTVPGGYNQNNGIPMFIQKSSFIAFVVADAISLVSSSASLLVFLSIRTSPYRQRDFLVSLPPKLFVGIVTLLISVTAMLATFSISFFVLYHKKLKWVPILISVFASVPLILYVILQHTLLVDMFHAAYDARYLFKPKKRLLYKRNQRFKLLSLWSKQNKSFICTKAIV